MFSLQLENSHNSIYESIVHQNRLGNATEEHYIYIVPLWLLQIKQRLEPVYFGVKYLEIISYFWGSPIIVVVWAVAWDVLKQVCQRRGHLTIFCPKVHERDKK
jgi:hypothetical protein